MEEPFQKHYRPNRSRLEPWRSELIQMRAQDWPYVKIAQWLLEKHGFRISAQAIHQFCQRRGISPKQGPARIPPGPKRTVNRSNDQQKPVFEYDDNAPIERWPK